MEIDIYTLAHEIKNPLAVASGYVEMSNEKNFSKYKELINNNIKEALQILDNYLEFNKLKVEKEIIDIILLLEEISNNERERYLAELREKYIMDQKAVEDAGFDKGVKSGIEQGIQQGIQQGKRQNTIEIAKKMKEQNIDIEIINKVTGLSITEINDLK